MALLVNLRKTRHDTEAVAADDAGDLREAGQPRTGLDDDAPAVPTSGGAGPPPAAADGRRLAGAGFLPASAGRADRAALRRRARDVERAARQAEAAGRRARWQLERSERRAAAYLPAAGEPGPESLRAYRPFKVPAHRATSEALAGAYPFLAEAGLGEKGVYLGADSYSGAAFCFDPWVLYAERVLTNPNLLIAGVLGKGKSTCAKCLTVRSIPFGRRVYVPGDPKGEWAHIAETVGGQAIALGGGLATRLNPLDDGPRPTGLGEDDWRGVVTARRRGLLRALVEVALGRALDPVEATALFAALDCAVRENSTPTLPHVVDAMFSPTAPVAGSTVAQLTADGRAVAHALNRLVAGDLAGLFDGPSTQRFDPTLPMVALDLSRISGSDQLIALVMTCASAWMEAALADPAAGPRWVVYDEAWRLVRAPALLARMQAQWKLSRALGIANLAIVHRLSDLDAVGDANSEARNLALGLLADCSTKIIYAQEAGEAERTAAAIGLTSAETAQLPLLEQGEALWKIKDQAYLVRTTLTAGEKRLYDTDARMVALPAGAAVPAKR